MHKKIYGKKNNVKHYYCVYATKKIILKNRRYMFKLKLSNYQNYTFDRKLPAFINNIRVTWEI